MRRTLTWASFLLLTMQAGGLAAEGKAKARPLEPWVPVDASFSGCSEGLCGTRGRDSRAIVQPGAKVGQYVYCPVSGAVFEVKESHQHAEVNGKPLYFCCEACARYFGQNRDRVVAMRWRTTPRAK